MWWERNLLALLAGMQTCAASVENSMESSQKVKNKLPFNPGISLLGNYTKNTKTLIQRDKGTSMFIAALFTIVKIWKQPKCPLTEEWIKKIWQAHIHNGILFIHKKEWDLTIRDNMDGPRGYHAK